VSQRGARRPSVRARLPSTRSRATTCRAPRLRTAAYANRVSSCLRITPIIAPWLLAGVVLHAGCGGSSADAGAASGATCDPQLSYAEHVAPLMQRYCVSCHAADVPLKQRHGAPGDHNFDSEQGVLQFAQHIDLVAGVGPAAENRSMPPSGFGPDPSDEERALLASYVACQLPEATPGEHVHAHTH
jgi:uncharacterized membrane protein